MLHSSLIKGSWALWVRGLGFESCRVFKAFRDQDFEGLGVWDLRVVEF